jgi:hypothetical protein
MHTRGRVSGRWTFINTWDRRPLQQIHTLPFVPASLGSQEQRPENVR